jgi:hypothetical protein
MVPKTIPLSDSQFSAVLAAAAPLPRGDLIGYFECVAKQLRGRTTIGDGDVHRACMIAQKVYFRPPTPTGGSVRLGAAAGRARALEPYWGCVQILPQREVFALNMLERGGFAPYAPRLREWRTGRRGQRQRELALFFGLRFPVHSAAMARRPLVPRGGTPRDGRAWSGKIADEVIEETRGRERNGAIEIPRFTSCRSGHGCARFPRRKAPDETRRWLADLCERIVPIRFCSSR